MEAIKSVAPLRVIGWLSLAALAINNTIGAGIFALPASAAALLGPYSPFAFLLAGIAIFLIALCFAEAGSQFDRSGGPYLYASAAFGPLVGFEVGWLTIVARITALGAISNTFSAYLGYFWPVLGRGMGQFASITLLTAALAALNYVGVRQGMVAVNVFTIGKLIPLVVFCVAGLFFLHVRNFAMSTAPAADAMQRATLMLVFAFGGFEAASIPTEEVLDPRRALPRAILFSVGTVVALFLLIQVVAVGTFPGLASSATPLASAAASFLGPAGGLLLTAGALLSTIGTTSNIMLHGPRSLYAQAARGQLPKVFARIHPRYRTPTVSVLALAFTGWVLAITGTFTQLVALTTLSRLLYYLTTCLAVPVLRRTMPASGARFRLPGGGTIPILAVAVCVWLLAGSSWKEAAMTGAALLVGAGFYGLVLKNRTPEAVAISHE